MKKLLATLAMLTLAACSTVPADSGIQPIRFTAQPPIKVAVAEIRFENLTVPQANAVDAQMPTAPATALQQWVNDRLVASGASGLLVVSVQNAAVLETKLPKTEGVKGFFTDDQDAKYNGNIVAHIRYYSGASAMAEAEASVNVSRGRSINEKATLAERERFYQQLVLDMMTAFNGEAELRIRQYLGQVTSY